MSDRTKDLRKSWAGLLGMFGGAAKRGSYKPPSLPGNFNRPSGGGITERRRGFGSAFQPSNVPGAKPLKAIDNGKSGSTMADHDSEALNIFRDKQLTAERKARKAWKGGGSLFRALQAGDLAKATLSEAQIEQRREAGKKSGEARRKGGGGAAPGGPTFTPTRRSLYSQYVPSKADRAGWDAAGGADQAPTMPSTGPFVRSEVRAQVPKALGEKGYIEIGQWASTATRGARPDIYERAERKKLVPEGTDPKTMKLAYNHARNMALSDVGLIRYDFAQTDDAIERLKPLVPFMRYSRESMQNVLLSGRPGEWAPFRREFGKEFKDRRTYAFDTRGQKAGEPKKFLPRNLQFLKDKEGKAPSMREMSRRVEKLAKAIGLAAR